MSKQKTQKTTTKETELAKTQAQILEQREDFAKQYFFPELLNELQNNTVDKLSPQFQSMALGATQGQRQQQTNTALRSLAQRGVTGGVQGAGLAQLGFANQQAKAQTRLKADQLARQSRTNTLTQIASTVPSPTTAAPYVTETV